MKTNSETCDTIQFNISDKLDSGLPLDNAEQTHIEACSDCKQFYEFVHADSFLALASHSAGASFSVEQVCQTKAIMERLQLNKAPEQKRSKLISITSISLATAAAAAVAVMAISSQIQPSVHSPDDSNDVTADATAQTVKKVNLPTLPKIKLEEKYIAFNNAVEQNLESVSHSIMKLKSCFAEGSAFLDTHTKEKPELAPEGRLNLANPETPIV